MVLQKKTLSFSGKMEKYLELTCNLIYSAILLHNCSLEGLSKLKAHYILFSIQASAKSDFSFKWARFKDQLNHKPGLS